MIRTPHLWLPDRLRERREDERLLCDRGGMSRRWMPGYPCCCGVDCPSDCSEMGDSRTITFTGFTGRYSVMNGIDIVMTRGAGTSCDWNFTGGIVAAGDDEVWYSVGLACENTASPEVCYDKPGWQIVLDLSYWDAINGLECDDWYCADGRRGNEPPLGAYTMRDKTVLFQEIWPPCDEDTVTGTLAKP